MGKNGNIKVTCSQCGKDTYAWKYGIDNNKTGNYFCDNNCKKLFFVGEKNPAFNSLHHNCDYCCKDMLVKHYNLKAYNLNFCNKRCKNMYDMAQYIEVLCDYCGTIKTMNIYEAKRSKHHFCDKQCNGKWMSINLSGANSPHYNKVSVACCNCGAIKHVETGLSKRHAHFFCNKKCKGEWMSKNILGKLSPLWNGGRTNKVKLMRNSLKMTKWRKFIFNRDNYTCMSCGQRGGKLNGHHIVPISVNIDLIFDTSNGITLCEKCHKALRSMKSEFISYYS